MSNNFNMSFDPNVRKEFAAVLSEYGLTVPQAFKLFANQVVKTGVVPLSFDWGAEKAERVPTQKLLAAIAELESGQTTTYESLDDFVAVFDEKN
ncbi:type II toxin-antitoxin system RelB/DinJ family antitoxin [Moraxella marmotae]|uniref:type II toxin-antitoxin system RelB/DinJ family antitoxin n=1 Tax=Moraxella marmotae TaxID=3344520 RepID=UPI0035F36D96